MPVMDLCSSALETKKRSQRWGDKAKRVKSSEREKWSKSTATFARLTKSWAGEGRSERRVPRLSRHAGRPCAWTENDQRDPGVLAGSLKG